MTRLVISAMEPQTKANHLATGLRCSTCALKVARNRGESTYRHGRILADNTDKATWATNEATAIPISTNAERTPSTKMTSNEGVERPHARPCRAVGKLNSFHIH